MKLIKATVVYLAVICLSIGNHNVQGQTHPLVPWHGKERTIRYRPDGQDFVIENGERRFNRALYGTNTGFRVEAGDLPEFALYMPGMGGNLQFGLIAGNESKWLIRAKHITARYRAGTMLYEIKDDLLGEGTLFITVLASANEDGMLIKTQFKNLKSTKVSLFWSFGGATGKRFSRDGDIGADPESSFYLKPEYCKGNYYDINENKFVLYYGSDKELSEADLYKIKHAPTAKQVGSTIAVKKLAGTFPVRSQLKISDASQQPSPLLFLNSEKSITPAITGSIDVKIDEELYFTIQKPSENQSVIGYASIPGAFKRAEDGREKAAARIRLITPDVYLNTLGGALSLAADGIWEDPTYLHGAVAWRMRLNAWRGAYVADPLGWHDRAKKHFSSYALSQLTTPTIGPLVPDTTLHFARQQEKLGTAMFSSGYICRNPNGDFRAHHYDMNLVFIDQLLNHFQWTGDLAYVKEMWPVIQRHLAWEKRNFDSDEDGLYDAYCCIWASDALEYANGGVMHSSSYNYKANKIAAQLAELIGEDPTPYQKESEKIFNAIDTNLWMPSKGWYAEYKDFLGNKLVHPAAALWTIYHAVDSDVPDLFKTYQSLLYVDKHIPHIPLVAKGIPPGEYYSLSTSNWMPYTWSINNVVLAEMLHTSLAYWQGGRSQEGFKLWKSALLESMYLSASPGGFEQLSFYDAIRGELYRDFADPIGMAARSLVEGLFGIVPNALNDTLLIRPGFPAEWNTASLIIPDVAFDFKRTEKQDVYKLSPAFSKSMNLKFQVKAKSQSVKSINVNGKPASWSIVGNAIEVPMIEVNVAKAPSYIIEIVWQGDAPSKPSFKSHLVSAEKLEVLFNEATVIACYDPQQVLNTYRIDKSVLRATIRPGLGEKTVFVNVQQGQLKWWAPISFTVKAPVEFSLVDQTDDVFKIKVQSNVALLAGKVTINPGLRSYIINKSFIKDQNKEVIIPTDYVVTGTNLIRFESDEGKTTDQPVVNWNIKSPVNATYNTIDLTSHYNDEVTNIFKNRYLSPRPTTPTLQIPWQGIGNWCYPLVEAVIDDSGLRKLAGEKNVITLPQGIPFSTPSQAGTKNIIFTSQWDNFPDSVMIPATGKGSHIYFLMAGSTNPMQSRFVNGAISVVYADNSEEMLRLENPGTWWPIEQDYYTDGFAFSLDHPKPIRVHLKTGLMVTDFKDYTTLKGYSNYVIDGGAATVFDLPLNPTKEIKFIKLKTIANEVIIGLMSATVMTNK